MTRMKGMRIQSLHYLRKLGIVSLCIGLLGGVAVTGHAANNKEKYEPRYSIMSRKAAESLLTDVQVVGEKIVAVGERGHIIVSKDKGRSWKQAKVPTIELLTAVHFPNEQYGWAVGHESLILHTKDGGANWEVQYADPYREPDPNAPIDYDAGPSRAGQPFLDVWFRNEKEGFAVGAYGYFVHTSDGGRTWQDWSDRIENFDGWHLNALGTLDGQVMFIAGEMGVLFRSTDGGETWETLDSPYQGSYFGIHVGPTSDEVLIFGLQGNIFKTTDGGDSWHEIFTNNTNGLMAGISVGETGVVLVGNGGVIMYSKDKGESFVKQITEDRQSLVGIAKTPNNKLVMVGAAGVTIATPNPSVLGIKNGE
ncbi:MAG: YCF48-related protein [Ketobacteraceae bacterium]|nr:YCF48-related protein [Ketobacteraceae bacterium]